MSKAKIDVGTEIKGKTSRAGADKVAKTRGGGVGRGKTSATSDGGSKLVDASKPVTANDATLSQSKRVNDRDGTGKKGNVAQSGGPAVSVATSGVSAGGDDRKVDKTKGKKKKHLPEASSSGVATKRAKGTELEKQKDVVYISVPPAPRPPTVLPKPVASIPGKGSAVTKAPLSAERKLNNDAVASSVCAGQNAAASIVAAGVAASVAAGAVDRAVAKSPPTAQKPSMAQQNGLSKMVASAPKAMQPQPIQQSEKKAALKVPDLVRVQWAPPPNAYRPLPDPEIVRIVRNVMALLQIYGALSAEVMEYNLPPGGGGGPPKLPPGRAPARVLPGRRRGGGIGVSGPGAQPGVGSGFSTPVASGLHRPTPGSIPIGGGINGAVVYPKLQQVLDILVAVGVIGIADLSPPTPIDSAIKSNDDGNDVTQSASDTAAVRDSARTDSGGKEAPSAGGSTQSTITSSAVAPAMDPENGTDKLNASADTGQRKGSSKVSLVPLRNSAAAVSILDETVVTHPVDGANGKASMKQTGKDLRIATVGKSIAKDAVEATKGRSIGPRAISVINAPTVTMPITDRVPTQTKAGTAAPATSDAKVATVPFPSITPSECSKPVPADAESDIAHRTTSSSLLPIRHSSSLAASSNTTSLVPSTGTKKMLHEANHSPPSRPPSVRYVFLDGRPRADVVLPHEFPGLIRSADEEIRLSKERISVLREELRIINEEGALDGSTDKVDREAKIAGSVVTSKESAVDESEGESKKRSIGFAGRSTAHPTKKAKTAERKSAKDLLRSILNKYPEVMRDPVYLAALSNVGVDVVAFERERERTKAAKKSKDIELGKSKQMEDLILATRASPATLNRSKRQTPTISEAESASGAPMKKQRRSSTDGSTRPEGYKTALLEAKELAKKQVEECERESAKKAGVGK